MKLKTLRNTRICKKRQSKVKIACIPILNSRLFNFFTVDDPDFRSYQTDKSDTTWGKGKVNIPVL
jgi:hypothetical protein